MLGYYHSIEEFGTVDGTGIRFVLFLSGCSLGCVFCHNPDTWARSTNTISVEEVLSRYNEYKEFYQASGGGITISGGEPLEQAEFVSRLFADCKRLGISTTLDTSGHASIESLAKVLPHTHEVLFCLKAACESKYKQLTTSSIAPILNNLRYAAKYSRVTVRYVVIPGINDELADIYGLASIMSTLPNARVELLPYHKFALDKWQQLGMNYQLTHVPAATNYDIERVATVLSDKGIELYRI